MRLGAHNSRNARKGVRGRLPTRADEAGRSALHKCTRMPRGVNQSRAGRIPANFMEVKSMTATQVAHIWRVLLELNGLKDFEVEIREVEQPEKEESEERSAAS